MSQVQNVDVVVLGAGPAGYVCAIRLAQLGKKVTVVERESVGGVCLNVGCIPSKALIHAGTVYDRMKHAADIGIDVQGGVKVNFSKMMDFKSSVVKKLTGGVSTLLKANGCQVIMGDAKFTGPKSLVVKSLAGDVTLNFSQCVIATGSRPSKIPGFEVDQKRIVDSTGALALTSVPTKLLCIGGGYIGMELGTFYAKIGSQVTVVEAGPQILGYVDPDVSNVVAKQLKKRGVGVHVNTKVKSCKATKSGVEVVLTEDGKDRTEQYDIALVTIGRTPNADGLDIQKTGVKVDARGFIVVDPRRATNVAGIYAIGDVAGQPMLAHKGSKEGIVAAEAIAGQKTIYDVRAMPAVIFTDPEIAGVGISETEAKQQNIAVKVGIFPMAANGRALSVGEPDGFVKVIGDAKSGKLLGVHIVGVEASNLIAEAALALEMGAHMEDLALTVHAHPTLPEALMEASEAALGHAIHIFQKK